MIEQGLESLLVPGGVLIASGIRIKDADKVSAALEAKSWGEIECREMNGWCAIAAITGQNFEFDIRYSEKQVNAILENYYEDIATLHQELVEYIMMAREGGGGEYWLVNRETD